MYFYTPLKRRLYLSRPWSISFTEPEGNLRFMTHFKRYQFGQAGWHFLLPKNFEFTVEEIHYNDHKQIVKLSTPYVTKAGKLSQLGCWITLDQLEQARFSLDYPADEVEDEPVSRFFNLDI